eukprot:3647313-Ditylum_brightwellii.AAC.1
MSQSCNAADYETSKVALEGSAKSVIITGHQDLIWDYPLFEDHLLDDCPLEILKFVQNSPFGAFN